MCDDWWVCQRGGISKCHLAMGGAHLQQPFLHTLPISAISCSASVNTDHICRDGVTVINFSETSVISSLPAWRGLKLKGFLSSYSFKQQRSGRHLKFSNDNAITTFFANYCMNESNLKCFLGNAETIFWYSSRFQGFEARIGKHAEEGKFIFELLTPIPFAWIKAANFSPPSHLAESWSASLLGSPVTPSMIS